MAISKLHTSASLKQVMDKFEEISLYDFSNIDIITASELPVSGKEGQVCVITNVKPNKIIVDFDDASYSFNNGDIFLKCYINDGVSYNFIVESNNIKININLRECLIKKNNSFVRGKAYIFMSGKWVDMDSSMVLYDAPYFFNQDVYGNFDRYTYTQHSPSEGLYSEFYSNKNGYMYMYNQSNSNLSSVQSIVTTNTINMIPYKKIQFDIKATIFSGVLHLGLTHDKGYEVNPKYTLSSSFDGIIEIDISNVNQDMYVGFSTSAGLYGGSVKVEFRSIRLLV